MELPNPEEGKGVWTAAYHKAEGASATLVLANDPDADRFSASEWDAQAGEQFTEASFIALLAQATGCGGFASSSSVLAAHLLLAVFNATAQRAAICLRSQTRPANLLWCSQIVRCPNPLVRLAAVILVPTSIACSGPPSQGQPALQASGAASQETRLVSCWHTGCSPAGSGSMKGQTPAEWPCWRPLSPPGCWLSWPRWCPPATTVALTVCSATLCVVLPEHVPCHAHSQCWGGNTDHVSSPKSHC